MNRYRPAPQHIPASLVATALSVFSTWCGMSWPLAFIPAGIFVGWAVILYYFATRPVIEIRESGFSIGTEAFDWHHVARLDSTAWSSPLVLILTLRNSRRIRVIYPGDVESASKLLRQVRRMSRDAVIDGLPYHEYWGDVPFARAEPEKMTSPKYQLLRSEDEEEIDRLFQRLKAAGHLDSKTSADDRQD